MERSWERDVGVEGGDMNLRQIEVFHAVYTAGSISAASRLLNVSQPSVSKVIKHTESRLGFALFALVKGRLVATHEAHVLFREVGDLYERIGTFQQTARNLRSQTEGCIRVGFLPSLALSAAPEAIARFRMVAPRASFEVRTVFHDNFRHTLISRECDIVIGHHLLQGPEIRAVSLGNGCVGALFRESMLPADAVIDAETLGRHEIISLSPSVAISRLVDAVVPNPDEQQRRIVVNTVYIAAALARQGVGMAVVDEFTARGIMAPGLCFKPIEPAVTFALEALHLAEHPMSRLTLSFLDVFRRILSRSSAAEAGITYPQVMAVANH
jgi:DNA-binding transcriptional LysR family regulator